MDMTGMIVGWIGFLTAPVIALAGFVILHRLGGLGWFRAMAASAVVLAVVIVSILAAISFTPVWANISALALADLAYCFLAFSCWKLRPLALRWVSLVVLGSPIAFSYFLLTVGQLGLLFIAGDYTTPPLRRDVMGPGASCTTTGWGYVFSDEGYTVHLFHTLPAIPFIHREVGRITVDETDPGTGPTSATCAEVVSAHPS